jgi:hypothetical protein
MATFICSWIVFIHLIDQVTGIGQKPLQRQEPLFGSFDWQLPWITVDDRIRGGSSQSYLESTGEGVCFHGTLDTTTLGGAGFASQQYWFERPLNANSFNGIYLKLDSVDEKRYSVNLVNQFPENRGDGRKKSQINYKATFIPQSNVIYLKWNDFKPNFRGKPVNAPPLNQNEICGLNLMMQSYFDEQSGEFKLFIKEIGLF